MPADSRAASASTRGFTSRYLDDDSAAGGRRGGDRRAAGSACQPAEVALAWVRDRPGVVAPIVGARTTAQLRTALASRGRSSCRDELVTALDDVSD